MKMTPLDIQQQRFRICFRGFDIREVDAFVERVTEGLESLIRENTNLQEEIERLKLEVREFQDREKTFKRVMVSAQETLDDMKHNAEKEAELLLSEAQIRAEKILSSADNRLYELHSDIGELKRQRMQLEVELKNVLEAHTKLLEISKEAMESEERFEEKLKFLKGT
jgi:cell division initiation protein